MRHSHDVLVLCYHAVSERWEWEYAVRADELERQLRLVLDRGYRGATFTDAVTGPLDGPRLVVTFDDAYRSVCERALPVLSRLGLPGTVFACTDYVGLSGPMPLAGLAPWLGTPVEEETRGMSWEQLDDLRRAGWEVGSHSGSHPRLTQLDDRELADELQRSKSACEQRFGAPCRSLAYPHGDVDARVVAAAQAAGYLAGATLHAGLRRPSPLQWPRVVLYRHEASWRSATKTARAGRALSDVPGWEALRRWRGTGRRRHRTLERA